MGWPEVTIGPCRLICGDAREVLPTLGQVDAVVTDPPYGIGEAAGKNRSRSLKAPAKDYGHQPWDDKPVDEQVIAALLRMSRHQIIFGGNYYALPPTSCWLVWDKKNGLNDFADCELAWTNLSKAVRRIEWMWHGMLRKGDDGQRVHPTQKPVGVMAWCMTHLPSECQTILDPFMGSGTTGIACIQLGLTFIGIERESYYFDIACRRIEQAYAQMPLFPAAQPLPVRQEQLALFGAAYG